MTTWLKIFETQFILEKKKGHMTAGFLVGI